MTPEQALAVLVQAAEAAPLPKAIHVQVEQAVAVLRELVARPTVDDGPVRLEDRG